MAIRSQAQQHGIKDWQSCRIQTITQLWRNDLTRRQETLLLEISKQLCAHTHSSCSLAWVPDV